MLLSNRSKGLKLDRLTRGPYIFPARSAVTADAPVVYRIWLYLRFPLIKFPLSFPLRSDDAAWFSISILIKLPSSVLVGAAALLKTVFSFYNLIQLAHLSELYLFMLWQFGMQDSLGEENPFPGREGYLETLFWILIWGYLCSLKFIFHTHGNEILFLE